MDGICGFPSDYFQNKQGTLKTPEFHKTYDPIFTKSKGMLKTPEFHAN